MNERTPFYLISTIFLFITIVLSLITTFHSKHNGADFFQMKVTIRVNQYTINHLWISCVGIFHKSRTIHCFIV